MTAGTRLGLRHVEAELLAAINEWIDNADVDVFGVPSWRGRWALVHSTDGGHTAVGSYNRATFRGLAQKHRIVIADTGTDLPRVTGMVMAHGGRWAAHREWGYRLTRPDKTGDAQV